MHGDAPRCLECGEMCFRSGERTSEKLAGIEVCVIGCKDHSLGWGFKSYVIAHYWVYTECYRMILLYIFHHVKDLIDSNNR